MGHTGIGSVHRVPDLDPRRVAFVAVLVVVVVVVGVRGMGGRASSRTPAAATLPVQPAAGPAGETSRVTVHVAGAVRDPGVYRLRRGARVDDAVRSAGGATRRADIQKDAAREGIEGSGHTTARHT